ncbi:MAG: RNA-binding protein [Chloroflexi bacterium]|nr:RNA-binding protein [Chloroflexota bacterium]
MNIYVGNLSYNTTEEELRNEFTAFGGVTSVSIIKDKYSGQSKGFAFVEMPVLSEGQAAIKGLHGKMLNDRALTVNGARERSESSGSRSYGGSRGGGFGGSRSGGSGGRGRQKRY